MEQAHWTKRLFVEEPELYLPFLEDAIDRAPAEVDVLVGLFGRHGVPQEGRVLDVACGIGRHSVLLAGRGYVVTGIDISPAFVRRAREYAMGACTSPRFIVGDMQAADGVLNSEEPFSAIISMFTSNGYYGREGDVELFSQLRRLAAPGAVLVVLTAHRDWLVRNFEPEGLDKAGGIGILQDRALDLETSTMRSTWQFYEDEGERLKPRLKLEMDHRIYSLHELKALLEEAGWHYAEAYGSDRSADFELGELTLDSKTMWVVARAQ